jgi:carboxymethylenebutenolidase
MMAAPEVRSRILVVAVAGTCLVAGCSAATRSGDAGAAVEPGVAAAARPIASPPAGAAAVGQRLQSSPRHAEWVMVRSGSDSVRSWVVYPERRDRAPVVVVIHEIFGLSSWIRGVADQLAADGFIAIAPDLLTGMIDLSLPDTAQAREAQQKIRTLRPDDVHRQIAAVASYGMGLPAALPAYGIVGFCWGGSVSFEHAVRSPPGLGAAVVYYGSSPATERLASIQVPVLGLYAGDDARVNATVPPADSAMKALGKRFASRFFDGSGHGFLRQQDGRDGANLDASRHAWPLTVEFFRVNLGR